MNLASMIQVGPNVSQFSLYIVMSAVNTIHDMSRSV